MRGRLTTSHKEADSLSSSGKTAHDHELSHVEDTLHESPENWNKLHEYYTKYPNAWARFRYVSCVKIAVSARLLTLLSGYIREPAAEALGCMILIIFGCVNQSFAQSSPL